MIYWPDLIRRIIECQYRISTDKVGHNLKIQFDNNKEDGTIFAWAHYKEIIWTKSIISDKNKIPIMDVRQY